jgi:hypothetical protein
VSQRNVQAQWLPASGDSLVVQRFGHWFGCETLSSEVDQRATTPHVDQSRRFQVFTLSFPA